MKRWRQKAKKKKKMERRTSAIKEIKIPRGPYMKEMTTRISAERTALKSRTSSKIFLE